MSNPLNSLMLEQNCDNALKTCNFAGPEGGNCASQFCLGFPATSGTCPQLGLDPQNCCGSSDPATCLNNWVHNGGGVTSNPCASVVSIIIECSSTDPTLFPSGSIYTSGPQATALAGCMCYDQNGMYDPDVLDGFASECVASGSAAHPTYYPYASRLNGFCTNNAGPATPAASTTATMQVVSSSMAGGTATATTTTTPVILTTATMPVSTKSNQQVPATSSAAVVTSSAVLRSSTSAASSPPASTTTASASSSAIKNTLQARIILLLSFSIIFSLY